MGLNRRQHQWT